MKYGLVEEQPCKRVFRVEMDAHEVHHAEEHALHHVSSHADLPGFRRGKVPAAVLRQRFGKQLDEEMIEHAVGHGARAVLEGTRLQPVVNPTVSEIRRSLEGMTYHLTIELAPEIVLGEYQGIPLTREPVIVRPEDVDSVVEGMRRRLATYAPAERAARWGDLAVIDYRGLLDGSPFEGSDAKEVMVFIGAGEAMREIEEALVGRRPGETFPVAAAYPADHANRALAGKTATLTVTLKDLKTGTLPAADDAFAKSLGDYASLEALRTAVRDRLVTEKDRETRERLRAMVVDRLQKFSPVAVAPSLVEEEVNYMAVRGAEELGRQGIRRIEQLRMAPETFRNLFRASAVRAVREAFVLEAIARKEGIAVSDEDLEQEIRASRSDGATPDQVIARLRQDGRWERLRQRLRQDRTLDWVIERATIAERSVGM